MVRHPRLYNDIAIYLISFPIQCNSSGGRFDTNWGSFRTISSSLQSSVVTEDLVCACRQDTCPPQVGCWHVIRFLIWILRNIYAIVLKATKEFSKAVSKSKTLSETFFYGSHNSNSVKIPSGLVMIFKIMILIRLRYAVMMNAMMMNGHRYLYMFQ